MLISGDSSCSFTAMLLPLIAASAGAVGLNYQATKELDGSSRRLPPFWPAFVLGAVTGLWIGVSFSSTISSTLNFVEKWMGFSTVLPTTVEDEDREATSSDEDDKGRRRRRARKH